MNPSENIALDAGELPYLLFTVGKNIYAISREFVRSIETLGETTAISENDPHQGAFGKWFYSYKTDSNVLGHQLNAIEAPHEAVHNAAKTIKELMRDNQYDLAMDAIRELKTIHYKTALHILSCLRETVANNIKELYIVPKNNPLSAAFVRLVSYTNYCLSLKTLYALSGFFVCIPWFAQKRGCRTWLGCNQF